MSVATPSGDAPFDATADVRRRLRERLDTDGNQPGWEAAWQEGLTPWDTMHENIPQPSLQWVCSGVIDGGLTTGGEPAATAAAAAGTLQPPMSLVPRSGKALVPGCGRGHDPLYLARRGLHCIGVDISATAVEAAHTWLSTQPNTAGDVAAAKERVDFVTADYFAIADGPLAGDSARLAGADLVYDFTFFCAIPPALHAKWAKAHAAALKPGGKLVALNYPLRPAGETSTSGPPYLVTPELYASLLSADFELEFQGVPPGYPEEKAAKELMQIWRRK